VVKLGKACVSGMTQTGNLSQAGSCGGARGKACRQVPRGRWAGSGSGRVGNPGRHVTKGRTNCGSTNWECVGGRYNVVGKPRVRGGGGGGVGGGYKGVGGAKGWGG